MADSTTFLGQFLYGRLPQIAGSGGSASGVLTVSTTSAATIADTNETDLWTYSMPASTLSVDGRGVRVTVWGTLAANANTKNLRIYFGSTSLVLRASTASGTSFRGVAEVLRTGASAQIAIGSFNDNGINSLHSTPASDTTAAITIKMTGQNGTASAADITFKGALVELLN